MQYILIPVIIVAVIAVIAGLGLSIAAVLLAVPKNEKAEAVEKLLPGANCGACGFSGCAGYAEALAEGKAENGLCAPGGSSAAAAISECLGIATASFDKKVALVRCVGTFDNTSNKMEYAGKQSCMAAIQHFGGVSECLYGCMGLGDCVDVCKFDAISVCNGVAHVDPENCTACGMCVKACPRGVIDIVRADSKNVVRCNNTERGVVAKKACKAACIGCMLCVKACPEDAVKVENFLARVDNEKCTGCGKCTEVCPSKCIGSVLKS